jgi:hypothetical protein
MRFLSEKKRDGGAVEKVGFRTQFLTCICESMNPLQISDL